VEPIAATPYSRTVRAVLVAILLLLAAPATARPYDPTWNRLIERLTADGLDPYQVRATFRDARMEPFNGLAFSLSPKEHSSLYRGFLRGDSVARARRCRAEHARYFRAAERTYQVPASVVAAILHVETQCGRNTGRRLVLPQLAKLAMADAPANVAWNMDRHAGKAPRARRPGIEAQVRRRARYLADTFYPEVLATFRLAARNDMDPLALRGSGAGAFGLPQFLPSSYLRFAVDGNGDGRVSLYDPADAIASAANYLRGHGWRPGITYAQQRQVVWAYNHSDAYIDTVLTIAGRIEEAYPARD
jgi:membrane-bound lytic murein transglycosylase B